MATAPKLCQNLTVADCTLHNSLTGTVSILSGPAECRQSAAECLRLARETDDSGSNALYLQMAQAWIKLADEIETRPARDALAFQGILPSLGGN